MKPGELVYCVVPPGFIRTFHLRFGTVRAGGVDDLTPAFTHKPPRGATFVEWAAPVTAMGGERVRFCYITTAWLRPIRDPGIGAVDEMLLRTPRVTGHMPSGIAAHEWQGGA